MGRWIFDMEAHFQDLQETIRRLQREAREEAERREQQEEHRPGIWRLSGGLWVWWVELGFVYEFHLSIRSGRMPSYCHGQRNEA